jgi:bifunctional UDP-N-acetylglucosamine pyrophosphorylase/glucosamine-1-phosphate N-acetyltransferase
MKAADIPSVLEPGDIKPELLAASADPERWTALIPAAGRGVRLGSDRPKILYPVNGKPILDHLLALLNPFCIRFVFVLSPSGRGAIEKRLEQLCPGRYNIAIQEQPTGMGDAVACGAGLVQTANTLVIWGDQAAVRPATIETGIRIHDGIISPAATVPTAVRPQPYIHLERDSSGRLQRLLQAREGDAMPAEGETDSGVFLFRTESLRKSLPLLSREESCRGRKTGEVNFLPLLPLLERSGERCISVRIIGVEESVGINTPEEAAYLSEYLRRAKAGAV